MLNRHGFDVLFNSLKKPANFSGLRDIVQSPDELWWIYSQVCAISPKTILEIGTSTGGTARIWETALDESGILVTVDLTKHDYSPDNFCDLGSARAGVHVLEEINSQDPNSVSIIQNYLQGRPVDFLYIDADHSYTGVKADYEIWTPLVRPGGLVGFHDTNHPPVRQLLQEKNHPRLVCVDHGFGTGLIQGW